MVTDNTFDNIDKKFQNDPMKTIGDMYKFFQGGLTFVALFTRLVWRKLVKTE